MKHTAMASAHSIALSSYDMRMQSLEHSVMAGNAAILARMHEGVDPSRSTPQATPAAVKPAKTVISRKHTGRQRRDEFRIALPNWFTESVWEFGVSKSTSGWDFRLHAINVRSRDEFVFDVVRSGKVPAVRALLKNGDLGIRDLESEFGQTECLLEVRRSIPAIVQVRH